MCIHVAGVFRGNQAQVKEYQELLAPIIFQSFEGKQSHEYRHMHIVTSTWTVHKGSQMIGMSRAVRSYWSVHNRTGIIGV